MDQEIRGAYKSRSISLHDRNESVILWKCRKLLAPCKEIEMNLLYFILYSLKVNVQSIVESNIFLDFLRYVFFSFFNLIIAKLCCFKVTKVKYCIQ